MRCEGRTGSSPAQMDLRGSANPAADRRCTQTLQAFHTQGGDRYREYDWSYTLPLCTGTQTIAEQNKSCRHQDERRPRKERHPPLTGDNKGAAFTDHDTPFGCGWLDTDP